MTAKIKPAAPRSGLLPPAQTTPWTTEERLLRIAALGQRINEYIQFMCQAGSLKNVSNEALEKAVLAFYERTLQMEKELGRIHDNFKLE